MRKEIQKVAGYTISLETDDNTYHACRIYNIKGELIDTVPFTYGYGDSWRQSAYSVLVKRGLETEADRNNHEYKRQIVLFLGGEHVTKKELTQHGEAV